MAYSSQRKFDMRSEMYVSQFWSVDRDLVEHVNLERIRVGRHDGRQHARVRDGTIVGRDVGCKVERMTRALRHVD
jgi:hypothetical protein